MKITTRNNHLFAVDIELGEEIIVRPGGDRFGKCVKCYQVRELYLDMCAQCWSHLVVTTDYLTRVIETAKESKHEETTWVQAASAGLFNRIKKEHIYNAGYAMPYMVRWLSFTIKVLNWVIIKAWDVERWLLVRFGSWPMA